MLTCDLNRDLIAIYKVRLTVVEEKFHLRRIKIKI